MSKDVQVVLQAGDHKKTFSKEHAENILNIQVKMKRDDWKIVKGQNLRFKDGKINTGRSPRNSKGQTEK